MADKTIKVRSPARKVNLPGRYLAVKRFAVNRMMNPRAQFIRVRGNISHAVNNDALVAGRSDDDRSSRPEDYAENKVYEAFGYTAPKSVKAVQKASGLIQVKHEKNENLSSPVPAAKEASLPKEVYRKSSVKNQVIKLRENNAQGSIQISRADPVSREDTGSTEQAISIRQDDGKQAFESVQNQPESVTKAYAQAETKTQVIKLRENKASDNTVRRHENISSVKSADRKDSVIAIRQNRSEERIPDTPENAHSKQPKHPKQIQRKLFIRDTAAKQVHAEEAGQSIEKTRSVLQKAEDGARKIIRTIIDASEKLYAALIAGGSASAVLVTFIMIVALIAGSSLGIFFSSEDTGGTAAMHEVVKEINDEYESRLEDIKNSCSYDELEMSGSRAVWSDVLSVYSILVTIDPDNPMEVASITDEKRGIIADIFWQMNDISYHTRTHTEEYSVETVDENGEIIVTYETETTVTLYIEVSHMTADEMAVILDFDDIQLEQLAELKKDEYALSWASVLYGISPFDESIVAVALSQIGNVGGEPYWSWYGFDSYAGWCACFVSWCADQCGYIDAGIIPKYAWVPSGVAWFQKRNQWMDNSFTPSPGTIIFFDWDEDGGQDGEADHTGIVEKVEDGYIYTIEGNTGDCECKEKRYPLGYYEIMGYGIPEY